MFDCRETGTHCCMETGTPWYKIPISSRVEFIYPFRVAAVLIARQSAESPGSSCESQKHFLSPNMSISVCHYTLCFSRFCGVFGILEVGKTMFCETLCFVKKKGVLQQKNTFVCEIFLGEFFCLLEICCCWTWKIIKLLTRGTAHLTYLKGVRYF